MLNATAAAAVVGCCVLVISMTASNLNAFLFQKVLSTCTYILSDSLGCKYTCKKCDVSRCRLALVGRGVVMRGP